MVLDILLIQFTLLSIIGLLDNMILAKYLKNWLVLGYKDRTSWLRKVKVGLRFYVLWKQSLTNGGNPLNDRIPWITYEACDFLELILTPKATVFEYGSGGSTLFYSRRVKQVISIEHHPDWFNAVQVALTKEGINNCIYYLIPPNPTIKSNGDPADPMSYSSGAQEYRKYSFREYVTSIDDFPDQFFDLVAIDGRARPSCLWHANRKVKVGGYLLLDDSERDYYQRAKSMLLEWKKFDFYGPAPYLSFFFQTTFWQKVKP